MQVRLRHPLALFTIAALVLVGVAFAAGACESDPTPSTGSPDSTPTTVGVETYTDPDYGYSFEYPAGWVLKKSDPASVGGNGDAASTVQVGDPEGASVGGTGLDGLVVRVYELDQEIDESMLPQVRPEVEGLIGDILSQNPSWEVDEDLTETNVGGVPGFRASFTFDWDADHPVRTASYFLFDGTIEYELVVQAATENWETDQGVFAAFVASFEPGPTSGDTTGATR